MTKEKKKALTEELIQAKNQLKEKRKLIQEMNKKLKMVEKGELPIDDIKPYFENIDTIPLVM
jgi:septal ring factor EnvC (AmiA/AmiB activator)